MDERREEREEREREERDDAREAAAERAYWQDAGLESAELVAVETWRWSR
jgi:hypothetical protein